MLSFRKHHFKQLLCRSVFFLNVDSLGFMAPSAYDCRLRSFNQRGNVTITSERIDEDSDLKTPSLKAFELSLLVLLPPMLFFTCIRMDAKN